MSEPLRLAFLGLSITSSWGNGHATTYRALVRALAERGHDVAFLERDVPWYRDNRDDPSPSGCRLSLYDSLSDLAQRFHQTVREADAVVVGSYVPDGPEVLRWVLDTARGLKLFYDIDTPVTLGKLERCEATYVAPELLPELDAYLSFTGGRALRILEQRFGVRCALPLYCSVDEVAYRPLGAPPFRELGYLGTYSVDRQPVLERLLFEPARRFANRRFVVAGSCYPPIEWPSNVERVEHVPPREHPAFYGSSRFTLNITRRDMVRLGYSPSVRLFEAAACGVPIISDVWPGIETFFTPGDEILLARNGGEVTDYLSFSGDAERRRIAERARERVLSEHTARHRARLLERYLESLAAPSRGTPRRSALRDDLCEGYPSDVASFSEG